MRVAPHGTFPGWRVVFACFVCMTITSGLAFYGLAVYLPVLAREHGWSVSSISAAVAVCFLVGGLAGVAAARQLARRDARVVMVAGGIIGGAALVALGHVEQVWHVYVVYAVLAVGQSFAGLVPATTVVTRWFHARRSVALAAASTGLSAGGILITPLVKVMLDRHGLAAVSPWLAAVWVIGIVPITVLMIRSDPESEGWQPDGERLADTAPPPAYSVPTAEALHSRFFLQVTVGYMFILGAQVGAVQHLVKLVEERRGSSVAALATTLLAAASIVARLAGGQAATRVSMARLAVGCAAVQAVALVGLSIFESTALMIVAILTFGATVGNLLMLHPLLVGQHFGSQNYAQIFSRSQLLVFAGTAAGPYLLGLVHDTTEGYRVAYLIAAVLSLAGAAILPRHVRSDEPVATGLRSANVP